MLKHDLQCNFVIIIFVYYKLLVYKLIDVLIKYYYRNPNAALIYTWPTAESSMRQARRQHVPPLPTTLRELGEYLDININK